MTPCASQEGVFVTHIIEAFWEEQDGPPKPVDTWLRAEGWRPARGLIVLKGGALLRAPAGRLEGLAWFDSPSSAKGGAPVPVRLPRWGTQGEERGGGLKDVSAQT